MLQASVYKKPDLSNSGQTKIATVTGMVLDHFSFSVDSYAFKECFPAGSKWASWQNLELWFTGEASAVLFTNNGISGDHLIFPSLSILS